MARERKVTKKTVGRRDVKSASKVTEGVKKPATGYSMRSSSKNMMKERRGKVYREKLNRATKLVIELHKGALKDLESH